MPLRKGFMHVKVRVIAGTQAVLVVGVLFTACGIPHVTTGMAHDC